MTTYRTWYARHEREEEEVIPQWLEHGSCANMLHNKKTIESLWLSLEVRENL